ncbi:pentatricopeptide repeat-containing protein, partial [Trifolium medium]|nr:pentatricopeptide repeat-containing protein [Trifolium medium]
GKEHEAQRLLDMMLKKGWLPDTTTHKLLIGSYDREGRSQATSLFDDSVSDILVEGLGDS